VREKLDMKFQRKALLCISRFWQEEQGQDMVEYSLLLAFIALAAVGLLTGVKTQIKGLFSTISSTLSSTNASAS
jgi:Flp pilus assembly pilin Flp